MRIFVASLFCLYTVISLGQSQYLYGKKRGDLIDLSGRNKSSYWFFAPGVTCQFGNIGGDSKEFNLGVDTTLQLNTKAGSAPGLYLEVGRYHIFPGGGNIFNYLDYSLAYKALKGKEKGTAEYFASDQLFAALDSEGNYRHRNLLLNFNLNNVIRVKNYSFIQNSLGFNLDYKIGNSVSEPITGPGYGLNYPDRLIFQFHYKLGFGYKINESLIITPMLETPILNIKNWENLRSTWEVFNTRYRPVILTVRFSWIKAKGPGDCPPVYDPANKDKNFE
jgi:hypothetical protein